MWRGSTSPEEEGNESKRGGGCCLRQTEPDLVFHPPQLRLLSSPFSHSWRAAGSLASGQDPGRSSKQLQRSPVAAGAAMVLLPSRRALLAAGRRWLPRHCGNRRLSLLLLPGAASVPLSPPLLSPQLRRRRGPPRARGASRRVRVPAGTPRCCGTCC